VAFAADLVRHPALVRAAPRHLETGRPMTRRLALVVAGAIALGPLAGCATVLADSSEIAETADPGGAVAIDAETRDALDAKKAAFDDWVYDWQSSGCDEERAAAGDLNCASLLSFGQLEATATSIAFGSLPDFGVHDDAAKQVAAVAGDADAAGTVWVDAECAGDPSSACAGLARDFVRRLDALQEELLLWAR
jgi:hypothetical protein